MQYVASDDYQPKAEPKYTGAFKSPLSAGSQLAAPGQRPAQPVVPRRPMSNEFVGLRSHAAAQPQPAAAPRPTMPVARPVAAPQARPMVAPARPVVAVNSAPAAIPATPVYSQAKTNKVSNGKIVAVVVLGIVVLAGGLLVGGILRKPSADANAAGGAKQAQPELTTSQAMSTTSTDFTAAETSLSDQPGDLSE